MFERRLKIIMLGLSAALLVVVLRLVDLQVVHARLYRAEAERVLLCPAKVLPFVRGRILDRLGVVLASDEPCWEVRVDYDVLACEASADAGKTSRRIAEMWIDLARFGGEPVASLMARGDATVARIRRWRSVVGGSLGYDVPIREERTAHAILKDLDDQQQIAARQRFAAYPWVHVEHGVRRRYVGHPSLGHVLGRLGAATAADLRSDPAAADPLGRLLATERVGVSGVEWTAERRLRGRRGRQQLNRRGQVVDHTPAVNGQDVTLSLRFDLQAALYELLETRLPTVAPESPGGSIVVLDVPSREVLALVSYPGYDANAFGRLYNALRDDTRTTPLRFRAVANCYEPGSIVKPLTCLAGLGCGVLDVNTTFHCDGYYDRERFPHSYRCWAARGSSRRKAHGDVRVSDAIAGSCNVFMYHVGDRLGPDRLCNYFDMAGFGRTTGTGLREERNGINPTPSWLLSHRNQRSTRGHARNFAIGQGELVVSPVQAANAMALYASGVSQEVTLVRDGKPKPAWRLPVDAAGWRAVREGLFRVTNDPGGTAYRPAHWTNGRFALCGKTGSATTRPSPTHYRVDYRDRTGESHYAIVPAKVKSHAAAAFRRDHPDAEFDPSRDVRVERVWPPPKPKSSGERHAHAWFAGYLQRVDPDGRPRLDEPPPIAFAVVVEFGGSGGHTTGPIARELSRLICEILGEDLDPDGVGERVTWARER